MDDFTSEHKSYAMKEQANWHTMNLAGYLCPNGEKLDARRDPEYQEKKIYKLEAPHTSKYSNLFATEQLYT